MLTLQFDPFPVLSTERLILREPVKDDADEIFFLRSDETVLQFLGKAPEASRDVTIEHIKKLEDFKTNQEAITWAITLKHENKLIGTICFWNIAKQHYRAELGYALHPAFQGQGIMQEALASILIFGNGEMKLHSAEAKVDPRNASSIKLLERNNFTREGFFKEDYFYNGKFLDTAVYSLLYNSKIV